jgi:hypothetical protein
VRTVIKLACEITDAPDEIDWMCRPEQAVRRFVAKRRENKLFTYLCTSCFHQLHPVNLVISGKLIEQRLKGIYGIR